MVVGSGDDPDSSVHLKGVEMSSSGGFWMKLRLFSTFWQFPMESANSGRVLKAVTTAVGAGDSVGGFDSKTARKITLFWSLVTGTRRCGELAIVGVAAGWKRSLLGVGGLVWTRDTSSECSKMLGQMAFGDFWVEDGEFSIFG